MLEIIGEAALPLLIGPESVLGLLAFALSGTAVLFIESPGLPLIGVIVPELLGIVIPVLALLLPLLPRGMKDGAEPLEEGKLMAVPETSSIAAGMVVLWFFWRWPRRPMPLSAFPPA